MDTDTHYGTGDGFRAYWTARGDTVNGVAVDAAVIPALVVASNWIDGAYFGEFGGLKVGQRAQLLEWPRSGVQDTYGYYIDSAVVPREVENATYEAALRQLQTPGVFFKDYTQSKYKAASVTGAVSVQYRDGNAMDFQTQLPIVAAILHPLLTGIGAGGFSRMSGDVSRT